MNDTGVIDNFLNIFTGYIDSGFGLLGGEVAFLSTTLIAIDVTLAGLFWAWGADEDVLQRLVKKTLYIGTFAFIIGNFSLLATIVFESFAGLGLQARCSPVHGRRPCACRRPELSKLFLIFFEYSACRVFGYSILSNADRVFW